MAPRILSIIILIMGLATIITADTKYDTKPVHAADPEKEMSLEEIIAANKAMRKQLDGDEQECQEKLKDVTQKNMVLRSQVDKDTPALEKMTKDAAAKLDQVITETSKIRWYYRISCIGFVILWANSVVHYAKEAFGKIKSLRPSSKEPKSQKENKKKNK